MTIARLDIIFLPLSLLIVCFVFEFFFFLLFINYVDVVNFDSRCCAPARARINLDLEMRRFDDLRQKEMNENQNIPSPYYLIMMMMP